MTLHKSKFTEIILEEKNSLIIDKFLPDTKSMTSADFKKEMEIFVEKVKEHKPENELVHLLDMNFVISPELQKWMNDAVFSQYADIIKRMAFLVPKEIFSQAAVEQTMEEEGGKKFMQQYFKTEDEAREWLLDS